MQTLILHVGMGKTGTTAIQGMLRRNAATLRERGIVCCDHWLLRETMGPDGFESPEEFARLRDAGGDALAERLVRLFRPNNPVLAGAHVIVWSNEDLIGSHEAVGRLAAQFVGPGRVAKIVLYLRHQLDWLASAYPQWCVRDKLTPGRIIEFERYRRESDWQLDYEDLLSRWQQAAGAAQLLPRAYQPGMDATIDFCIIAGIPGPLKGVGERVHVTPGYTANALLKVVNDQYESPHLAGALMQLLVESGVASREFHAVDPCISDLSDEALDRIAAEYDARNSALAKRYGIELRHSGRPALFGRREGTSPDNTDLIAALAQMIVHLYDLQNKPAPVR